jgi:hypothetical protein
MVVYLSVNAPDPNNVYFVWKKRLQVSGLMREKARAQASDALVL